MKPGKPVKDRTVVDVVVILLLLAGTVFMFVCLWHQKRDAAAINNMSPAGMVIYEPGDLTWHAPSNVSISNNGVWVRPVLTNGATNAMTGSALHTGENWPGGDFMPEPPPMWGVGTDGNGHFCPLDGESFMIYKDGVPDMFAFVDEYGLVRTNAQEVINLEWWLVKHERRMTDAVRNDPERHWTIMICNTNRTAVQ